jgi:hypothetical protein
MTDYSLTVTVLFFGGLLSDERTGLPFVYAACPRQRSLSRVQVPWDSWPSFTASHLRLPFRRLLRLAGSRWSVTALFLTLRDEGRWGTGRLTSPPSRCLPGRRRWSWVESRCVWLDQAPPLHQITPLLPLWVAGNVFVGIPGSVGRQRTLDVVREVGICGRGEIWRRYGID